MLIMSYNIIIFRIFDNQVHDLDGTWGLRAVIFIFF